MNRDNIERAYERAEDHLDRLLEDGVLSIAEYNAEMRELARDYRDEIEQGALDAADEYRRGGW